MEFTLPTVLILGLLSAVTPLAIDTYLPSIPTIARSIVAPIDLVQLTVSVYLLTFALLQLFFGPLSDSFGRRKIVLIGLTLYMLGSIVCALANSFEVLILGRVIQACGGAAVAVCVPALVSDSFSKELFSKAMSYVFLVMAIAPLIAPIIGGAILVVFDWHYIFLFLALMAIISIGLFSRYIPETLPAENRVPFSFVRVIKGYRRLLRNRGVVGHIVTGAFHFGGLMCLVTGSAFVYIELYQVEEVYFGFLFGAGVVGMMLMTTVNSQLVEKVGSKKMIYISLGLIALASLTLASIAFMNQPPLWALLLATTLFIAPISSLGSNLMVGALAHAQESKGSVVALTGTSRFMGGALSGGILSFLHNDTFVPMVGIMAVMGLLSLSTYLLIVPKNTKVTS
ncbi:Bcr/CflA family multidrug efflux MFS transporter [Marinomonas agarivorans]|nr:Bcr/CflA family multidrug efflux MFS transporter [Marinomonas agarivorans]